MKILVACEESQRVCAAFRERGHEAYSCDILFPSGGHPEWAIQGDVIPLLNGNCEFTTVEGGVKRIDGPWDLLVCHPPCTYLTNVATRHHSTNCTPLDKINARTMKRIAAMEFFMKFAMADCERIAIENPVGVMNTCYRKPDQTIHPYQFAESEDDMENYVTKATCLWLKNLPLLPTNDLEKPNNRELFGVMSSGKVKTWEDALCRAGGASLARSKTFPGIAKSMANTWG